MEDLWHSRRPPEPLDLDALLAGDADANGSGSGGGGNGSGGGSAAVKGSACKALGLADAHAVWDVRQNAQLFLAAVQAYLDERADELGAAQVRSTAALLFTLWAG